MAEDETCALQKEIEYLTNLINGAGCEKQFSNRQLHNSHSTTYTRPGHRSSTLHNATPGTSYSGPRSHHNKYSFTRVPSTSTQHLSQGISQTNQGNKFAIRKINHNLEKDSAHPSGRDIKHTEHQKKSIFVQRNDISGQQSTLSNVAKSTSTSAVSKRVVKLPQTGEPCQISGNKSNSQVKIPLDRQTKRLVKPPSIQSSICPSVNVEKSVVDQSHKKSTSKTKLKITTSVVPSTKVVTGNAVKPSDGIKVLSRSASHSDIANICNAKSGTKVALPRFPTMPDLTSTANLVAKATGMGVLTSPTVIRAGEKIVQELERLNKAVALLDTVTRKNKLKEKANLEEKRPSVRESIPMTKPVTRTVVPHSSTSVSSITSTSSFTMAATGVLKKDKYRLVKESTVSQVPIQHISTSVQSFSRSPVTSKPNLAKDNVHSIPSAGSEGTNKKQIRHNPYKLVRTLSTELKTATPQVPLKRSHTVPSYSAKVADKTVVDTSNTSPFKLIRCYSSSPTILTKQSKRAVHVPTWSPRKRVYLSKCRLQNGPIHLPSPPTKYSAPEKQTALESPKPSLKTSTKKTASQSADVKELLMELSLIDAAFKTAKLQSSQKLLKKALITKQKMMRRKSLDRKIRTSATASRHHTKWRTPVCRSTTRLRTHSQSRASNKSGQKSWKSRFSIKKSTDLGAVTRRSVSNVSSNKYKFIKSDVSLRHTGNRYVQTARGFSRNMYCNQHQGRYSYRRATHMSMILRKNSLRVDRRPKGRRRLNISGMKSPACPPGARLVTIGGLVYATSRRKLSRTTRRTSFTQKGGNKSEARTVVVEGQQFKVTPNMLYRVNKDKDGMNRVSLGGVQYVQTRPGKLVRAANTASRATASRFVYRSIATAFGAAARHRKALKSKAYCTFYNRFGKCNRGNECPYIHDPDKVAVCTRFLRGTCKVIDCAFSHQVAPHKMPVCTHFLSGACSRDACPYRHVKVSKDAAVCRDFVNGYCPLADKCMKKHSRVCPENDGQGRCPLGTKCKLFHPRRGKKRIAEGATPSAVRKPRTHAAPKVEMKEEEEDEEAERNLPMAERHLPAFIPIFRTPVTCAPLHSLNVPTPGEEPLQIRPNLSFDGT